VKKTRQNKKEVQSEQNRPKHPQPENTPN
jgi:hypothetical protein